MERRIVKHASGLAAEAAIAAEFQAGQRVRTIDGLMGRILEVTQSFTPGIEQYQVVLDNGMGGGTYTASQLRPVPQDYGGLHQAPANLPAGVPHHSRLTETDWHEARYITEDEARAAARGEFPDGILGRDGRTLAEIIRTAADDYPEFGSILHDRPDPATQIRIIGASSGDRSTWAPHWLDREPIEHPGADPVRYVGSGLTHVRHPADLPGPLYHGTHAELDPGDHIEPGHPGNFVSRMKHVYMTEHPESDEGGKGARGYGPNVYEVQPTGPFGHRRDARGSDWATEDPVEVIRRVTAAQYAEGYDAREGDYNGEPEAGGIFWEAPAQQAWRDENLDEPEEPPPPAEPGPPPPGSPEEPPEGPEEPAEEPGDEEPAEDDDEDLPPHEAAWRWVEGVLGRDIPVHYHNDEPDPTAASDMDHPNRYGWEDKHFSLHHVPIESLMPWESKCSGGRHGAHCYTADHFEQPGYHHDVGQPDWDEHDNVIRDDSDYVREMVPHAHELPALMMHPEGGLWGGGHRLAAWRDAGWTHVPAWVPDMHHEGTQMSGRPGTSMQQVDDHGDAPDHGSNPDNPRAADPNSYDGKSTEGTGDSKWDDPEAYTIHRSAEEVKKQTNGAQVGIYPEGVSGGGGPSLGIGGFVASADHPYSLEHMMDEHRLAEHAVRWMDEHKPGELEKVHERAHSIPGHDPHDASDSWVGGDASIYQAHDHPLDPVFGHQERLCAVCGEGENDVLGPTYTYDGRPYHAECRAYQHGPASGRRDPSHHGLASDAVTWHPHEGPLDPVFGARYQYSTYGKEPGTYEDHDEELEGPFYHGSRSKNLKPGTMLTPGRRTNGWGDEGARSQWVHVTTEPETAHIYAHSAGGHAYEVEPTGVIHMGYGGGEYKTKDPVRVIRRLAGMEHEARVPWTGHERGELHEWDNGTGANWGDFVPSSQYHQPQYVPEPDPLPDSEDLEMLRAEAALDPQHLVDDHGWTPSEADIDDPETEHYYEHAYSHAGQPFRAPGHRPHMHMNLLAPYRTEPGLVRMSASDRQWWSHLHHKHYWGEKDIEEAKGQGRTPEGVHWGLHDAGTADHSHPSHMTDGEEARMQRRTDFENSFGMPWRATTRAPVAQPWYGGYDRPGGTFIGSEPGIPHDPPDPHSLQGRYTYSSLRSEALVQRRRADSVYSQLAKDYPAKAIEWVHSVRWHGPEQTALSDINWKDRHQWAAYNQPERVAKVGKKNEKREKAGKPPKFATLTQVQGRPADIADGHHRGLDALIAGHPLASMRAEVPDEKGPWAEMHAQQFMNPDTGKDPGPDGTPEERDQFHGEVEGAFSRLPGDEEPDNDLDFGDQGPQADSEDEANSLESGDPGQEGMPGAPPVMTGLPPWTQGTNPAPGQSPVKPPRAFAPPGEDGKPDFSSGKAKDSGDKDASPKEKGGKKPSKKESRLIREASVIAARDPAFGFEFTASWRDVVAKAKRIRRAMGVRITLISSGMVIGEVRGDHDVYESGIQRVAGKPRSIMYWACGCPWASFHQDKTIGTRYAGRPCSHVMALQFEASSRTMNGRELYQDPSLAEIGMPPRQVVVKSLPPWGPGGWNQTWLAPAASKTSSVEKPGPDDPDWARPGDIYGHMERKHPDIPVRNQGEEALHRAHDADHAIGRMDHSHHSFGEPWPPQWRYMSDINGGMAGHPEDLLNTAPYRPGAYEHLSYLVTAADEDEDDVPYEEDTSGPEYEAGPVRYHLGYYVTADQANAPWGSQTEPSHPPTKPFGATEPRAPETNPASHGFLSMPDPENWGEIQDSSYVQQPLSNTAGLEHIFPETEHCLNCGVGFERPRDAPTRMGNWRSKMPHLCNDCWIGHVGSSTEVGKRPAIDYDDKGGMGTRQNTDRFMKKVDQGGARHWTSDDALISSTSAFSGGPDTGDWAPEYQESFPFSDTSGAAGGQFNSISPADPQGIRMEEALSSRIQAALRRALAELNDEAPQLLGGLGAELHEEPQGALDPEGVTADDVDQQGPTAGSAASISSWGMALPDHVGDTAGQYALDPAATGGGPGMSMHDEDLSPWDSGVSIQTIGNQQWSGGGADSDEVSVEPGMPQGDEYGGTSGTGQKEDAVIRAFQASAGGRSLMSKTAEVFSDAEAGQLIAEGRGTRARNLDLLDISGTHYEDNEDEMQHRGLSLDHYDDDLVLM